MLNLNDFISKYITLRDESMFLSDIEAHRAELAREIEGKRVCVIGGGGTIGSSFIRALLPFKPQSLVVVDLSENYLTELTRTLRSTAGMYVPADYRTYPLNYADPIFEKIFRADGGYDIVANFSAHKHVRSEKDQYSVEALIENNDLKAKRLMDMLAECPPQHFFCVSTDKAANPVNIMGCSKKVMEEMIMAYSSRFKVTTARFANVAFSNGSLPRAANETTTYVVAQRRATLLRLARRERPDMPDGLHLRQQPRDFLPQARRRADDDILRHLRRLPHFAGIQNLALPERGRGSPVCRHHACRHRHMARLLFRLRHHRRESLRGVLRQRRTD